MKIENFIKIYKTIKENPYYGEFKLGDMVDLSSFDESKEEILKGFFLFICNTRGDIRVSDETSEVPDDFDVIYDKRPEYSTRDFEDISKVGLLVQKFDSDEPFIIPQLIRNNDSDVRVYSDIDSEFEASFNKIVKEKIIPNVSILGKAFGYTVYKKN